MGLVWEPAVVQISSVGPNAARISSGKESLPAVLKRNKADLCGAGAMRKETKNDNNR